MIQENETLWVVGDIHGMYDPLKRLITEIRRRGHLYGEKVYKIIFIGDYIDYGPSSREVLDLLMGLEFPCVFMAGNHEDMLLHLFKKTYFYKEYGNMWFNGNGGQDTVLSFNPPKDVYENVDRHPVERLVYNYSRKFEPEDFVFEKKYMDFFENLVYVHSEEIGEGDWAVRPVFSHAGLDASRDLEQQLGLNTFDRFHDYVCADKIYMKDFNLWSRREPEEKFGDYILIHGHTPTSMLPQYYGNIGGFKPASGLPYFRFKDPGIKGSHEEGSALYTLEGGLKDLISINVDTGAAFGEHLTAISFNVETPWTKKIGVLQVAVNGVHRGRRADVRQYAVKFNG